MIQSFEQVRASQGILFNVKIKYDIKQYWVGARGGILPAGKINVI